MRWIHICRGWPGGNRRGVKSRKTLLWAHNTLLIPTVALHCKWFLFPLEDPAACAYIEQWAAQIQDWYSGIIIIKVTIARLHLGQRGASGAVPVPLHRVTMDPETDGGQGDTRGKWSDKADKSWDPYCLISLRKMMQKFASSRRLRVQYSQVMGIWHQVGIIVALSELNDPSGIAWRKTNFVTLLWGNTGAREGEMMSHTKTSSIPIMLGLHASLTWRQRSLTAGANTRRWRVTKSWKLADGVELHTWKASSRFNTSYT